MREKIFFCLKVLCQLKILDKAARGWYHIAILRKDGLSGVVLNS